MRLNHKVNKQMRRYIYIPSIRHNTSSKWGQASIRAKIPSIQRYHNPQDHLLLRKAGTKTTGLLSWNSHFFLSLLWNAAQNWCLLNSINRCERYRSVKAIFWEDATEGLEGASKLLPPKKMKLWRRVKSRQPRGKWVLWA